MSEPISGRNLAGANGTFFCWRHCLECFSLGLPFSIVPPPLSRRSLSHCCCLGQRNFFIPHRQMRVQMPSPTPPEISASQPGPIAATPFQKARL
jgi:hypothetical protein